MFYFGNIFLLKWMFMKIKILFSNILVFINPKHLIIRKPKKKKDTRYCHPLQRNLLTCNGYTLNWVVIAASLTHNRVWAIVFQFCNNWVPCCFLQWMKLHTSKHHFLKLWIHMFIKCWKFPDKSKQPLLRTLNYVDLHICNG